jgi:DGQHR domain-containing protein
VLDSRLRFHDRGGLVPHLTVQKFTQRRNGKPVDLYLGAVRASEVIERSRVDIQSAENPKAYQRALQPSRVRSLARYVDRGDGLLPTSLGLNIRNGAWFEEDSADSSYGKLHFCEEEPWWVWEGQHRSGGIAEAIPRAAHRPR